MTSAPTVIYLPQKLSRVAAKIFTLFTENVLVPAVLIGFFASREQTVLGVLAVFAWRVLFFGTRWRMFRIIPATSVLTFTLLSARTGVSFTLGATASSGAALTAYMLPAAIISIFLGFYFLAQGFKERPVTLRLAADFVEIPEECQQHLLPFTRVAAWAWGGIHVVSGIMGAMFVLQTDEKTAGMATSILSIATPLSGLLLTGTVCVYLALRGGVRLSLKQPAVAAVVAAPVLPAVAPAIVPLEP